MTQGENRETSAHFLSGSIPRCMKANLIGIKAGTDAPNGYFFSRNEFSV